MEKNNEACDLHITGIKKDLGELFDRVRHIETYEAVATERDKALLEKMDNLNIIFTNHDKKEMSKYNIMQNDLQYLTKFAYIATGIGLILGFIGIDNVKAIVGG